MIVIILITLFVLNKYNKKSIENNILDNKWYSYDNTTGFYDIISFEDGKFLYNKSSSSSKDGVFDSCTKYYYNKFNRSISLDCGIVFEVENFGSSKMSLWVNDRKKTFFLEPNDSLNYEFENYYNYSISEYKKDKKQNTELIKIDTNRLIEVIKSKEYSTIVFMGDNCSSVDCVLFLDTLEKWISKKDNVYFIDTNNITNDDLIKLNKLTNFINTDIEEYNDIYPLILEIKDNNLIDNYKFKCSGFNCLKYN